MTGDEQVEALLAALTWEQKLAQLQIAYRPSVADAAELVRGGIGAVFWPRDAANTAELQRVAREETPHGIPLLVGLDVVHGQHTIFPIPLAQAASFDPDVAHTDGRVSATEAASGGVTWTFSPMVDVSRDPRWGRVAEGFGEDPHLSSVFGAATVRGYQGDDLASPTSIAACAKHYVAYGAAEGGRDYAGADLSEARLRSTYLPPFRAAVDAGVATVMASFNTVNGRPVHAHHGLLTGVLKDEWGFGGVVVGDADGVANLVPHGIAEDLPDALRQAFTAGLDVEMGGNVVAADGRSDLAPADLPVERVDDAVRRVLRLKQALGLLDGRTPEPAAETTEPTADTRAAARRAAERCAVLLQTQGVLPLPDRPLRVLLVGPYADSTDHLGAWVQSFASPAGRLSDALRAERPDLDLTVLPGAVFSGADPALQQDAVRAAADADVVLVAVGEPSDLTGEASSRSDLRLPGDQEALVHAVADTGRPFAVVLVTGRPLVTASWIDRAPDVLLTWHLGTEAAPAIARLLTGAAAPAGRLPMTFPRSVGQIPVHHAEENTGRPATTGGSMLPDEHDIGLLGPDNLADRFTSKYRDLPLGPQFAFGHGLGYTTTAFGTPTASVYRISIEDLRRGDVVTVSVPVTNTGARAGDEVVQLYLRDPVASLAQPVRRLRAFRRVALDPGVTSTVTFELGWSDLGFWTGSGAEYVVEAGRVELHVGPRLDATAQLDLVLT